jgi:hypothetical protein
VHSENKARVLHIKLARLAKTLKRWNKQRITAMRRDSEDAQQLVLQVDQTQDHRPHDDEEIQSLRIAKEMCDIPHLSKGG